MSKSIFREPNKTPQTNSRLDVTECPHTPYRAWGVQCSADSLYRKSTEMRGKTVTAIQNLCTAFRKSQHLKYTKKLRLCIGPGPMHRRSFSAWFHRWDSRKAVHKFQNCSHSVTVLKVIWYHFRYSFAIFEISPFLSVCDRLALLNKFKRCC